MTSARETLKRETDEIHQQLHDLPAFVDLMNGQLSSHRYKMVMSGFLGFYDTFDSAAAEASRRFSNLLEGYTYEPRSPLFRADVAALGGEVDGITQADRCAMSFDSVSEYVGALYVVDGSVLGGMTMNKALTRNPELVDKGGKTYWLWCQRNGLNHWRSTLKLVEQAWQRGSNTAAITAGAIRTFSSMHDCLKGVEITANKVKADE